MAIVRIDIDGNIIDNQDLPKHKDIYHSDDSEKYRKDLKRFARPGYKIYALDVSKNSNIISEHLVVVKGKDKKLLQKMQLQKICERPLTGKMVSEIYSIPDNFVVYENSIVLMYQHREIMLALSGSLSSDGQFNIGLDFM